MKKNIIWYIILPFILLISSCGPMVEKFPAEIQDGISEPIEIKLEDYNQMINEKKSFILYISSPTCGSCKLFNDELNPFIEETSIVIYKIHYSEIKGIIDYHATPAISIIKDGEIINTINMLDNEKHFKSTKNIKSFILRYVTL